MDEAAACRKYRKLLLDDRKKVQNSFFPGTASRQDRGRGDAVPEEVGPALPPADYSDLSRGLESWCLRGSWAMCKDCGSLQPRPLHEIDLAGDPKVDLPPKQCRRCSGNRDHYVPQLEDVPEALRGLSPAALAALSPLEVDVGPETRSTDAVGRWNGYRKKMKLITFLWAADSVKQRVKSLQDRAMRRKAKEAHRYLLASAESSYRRFHDLHAAFLAKHGTGAAERQRKRPYHFLQEVGLECAVWPHLYWCTAMTETFEQWSDGRRAARRADCRPLNSVAWAGAANLDSADEAEDDLELDEDADAAGAENDRRTSVKRSFLAKCLSPLLGYGSTFELVQFVFDLNLWATLGAKKNLGFDNVPMRVLMKGHTFSPLYWREVHSALVDLVRQVGLPKLFFTIAPWEPSFKYHEWLQDEMRKTLRSRMNLPVGETLHMTHVLLQIVRGFLAGNNQQTRGRADRQWRKHIFSAKDAAGKPTRVITFTRLEFQDGSRKEGTKRYDGSGRPHLHVLFFTDDMADMQLEHHLFATKPEQEPLQGYVHGSQRDRRGADDRGTARWPVYDGEPGFNEALDKLLLKRKAADVEEGLRVFCADLMDGLPCHQDWQAADGEALLLQYVSKYVAKFSDSSYDEWMSDQASADSVARRVCFEYHPYEPEMILQLCGAQMRQYDISTVSGGFKTVAAPYAGMETVPEWVQRYATCAWRSEDMSLLEWLRKSNDAGQIAGWLRARHKEAILSAAYDRHCASASPAEQQAEACFQQQLREAWKAYKAAPHAPCRPLSFVDWVRGEALSSAAPPLEADFPDLVGFACDYRPAGEKVVAVETVYELNDRYYGQWAAMHVPFRALEDLLDAEVDAMVPAKYRHLATARRLCADDRRVLPEHRRLFLDAAKLTEYLRTAAKTAKFIDNVWRMIIGQGALIDMYLSGALNMAEERAAAAAEAAVARDRRPPRDAGAEAATVAFNHEQLRFEAAVNERLASAIVANHSVDWQAADEARETAWAHNTPVVALGKPGTGKTTVVKACIRNACSQGGRVLFALPTAQLASRMREAFRDDPEVEVATCHAAFKLDQPLAEALPLMTLYDLVVVDEVSLLDCPQFERILKLWSAAERVPALVFLGDMYQLPGVGATRPWESSAWRSPHCYHIKLVHTWRCKEQRFQDILDELRTSKPSAHTLRRICQGRKAWRAGNPTPADLRALYGKRPDTQIVTCTRRGAAAVNAAAVDALYGRKTPLATLPGDVEQNQDNYVEGQVRTDRVPAPTPVPIFRGMQLYLTKNVRKEDDYINGMLCTVEAYMPAQDMLRVRTKTGHRLAITRWTDADKQGAVYFPIRLGYASTIHKVQGDEFAHITVYLDIPGMPAAGYTALSRVATSDCYLLGGHVTREHFVPAM